MSQRVSLNEIIRQYGVPLTVLEVMATNEQCIKLRDYLMSFRGNKEQAYLEVQCSFFIDVDDIDKFLKGERNNLAEIYTYPNDVKVYKEE